MGVGPVAPAAASGSWRLAPEHAAITQGLVVSPFEHLPEAVALLLCLPLSSGGAWLDRLRRICPITDATGPAPSAAAIAFTWTGLHEMGLDSATLATFSPPFQEGMRQIDRQRRLSDTSGSGSVIPGGPLWSANVPSHADPTESTPSDLTPLTVHAVLLLYGADDKGLETATAGVEGALQQDRIEIVRRLRLSLRRDALGRGREHFGFTDGISQPVPQGDSIVSSTGQPMPADPLHGIAAGDILIGHCNSQGEPSPGPILVESLAGTTKLKADGAPEGFRNLGLNGSYLVVRELRQDVAAFWNSMYAALGGKTPDEAIWFASRIVGRTMDGDMLIPGGTLPPVDGEPQNTFTFFATDPHGLGCPIGSHVRRSNPRDGLSPDATSAPDLLAAAQNHRILRRGRKFGPTIEDPRKDDKVDRGLLFMCFNTDLVRQFEFVQQTWLLNANFGTLLNETDPLLGPKGRFTIPAEPLRLRPTVESFVYLVGGDYFFFPSLLALDYLQTLPAGATS
jgi:Dyp-type peroxidase family